jgi:alpha-tubulin suppressor-like RCC1 family protein
LFSVGFNEYGCIGHGKNNCSTITQIDYFSNIFIVDIACGWNHSLSISNKGEIYSWGDNRFGQIGNGKSGKIEINPIKIFKI